MPDFVDGDREAKNQKELHRIFELLEQDFREFFPDWEKKCLWKVRYMAPFEIAAEPGLVGKHRPPRDAHGIKNLYIASDTARDQANLSSGSGYEAIVAADAIIGKK